MEQIEKSSRPKRTSYKKRSHHFNLDDTARFILVLCTSVGFLISLIAYLYTKDTKLILLCTTIGGGLAALAFKYYFSVK